jgi:hypothetical protein
VPARRPSLIPPDEPGPLLPTAPTSRRSRWLIMLGAAAAGIFVAGAVWAVTGPSRGTGTTPELSASAARLGQVPDFPPGTPAPGSPSGSPHPGTSGARPSGSAPTGSPAASGSPAATGPASASPSPPAPAAVGSGSASTSVETWSPNGLRVIVTITAGSSGLSGWRATVTCAGLDVPSGSLWNATRVAGAPGTITVRGLDWNGTLAAGKTTQFGFVGSWSGTGTPNCTTSLSIG